MATHTWIHILILIAALTAVPGSASASPAPTEADVRELLVEANALVFELALAEDRLLTLKGLRTAAMMHLAVHDALNSIEPQYHKYLPGRATAPGTGSQLQAEPGSAVAEAVSVVLSAQYPEWRAAAPKLAAGMSAAAVTQESGRRLGRECAEAVLAARAEDAWNTEAEYAWHPMGPGVYAEFNEHSGTPEGFVFGAGWAEAEPFVLDAADQFRSPPPPEITSEAYADAFKEVKDVGRYQTLNRTPDQTHLALWWKDFVENFHNRLARQLVRAEGLGLWETARLFALVNIAVYDAYINVFENKFHYNHWRPYTAIRWAAHDGNPSTEPDTLWDNTHRHTYAFPSYPSAHGAASAAAMTVLADTFGDGYPFTMHIPVVDAAGPLGPKVAMEPPTRSFASFAQAAMECSMSRVYLGIHFRYDSVEGNALGSRVGAYVVEEVLTPAP